MVVTRLYVEGGGDGPVLRTACRQGFSDFLQKAGLAGRMPRIVACGARRQAYEDFCRAVAKGDHAAILLIDSEGPVEGGSPWAHLARRPGDAWVRPPDADDEDCHLMVQCMESWLVSDPDALGRFFGQGFSKAALPSPVSNIEVVARDEVQRALVQASKSCRSKPPYSKGAHSFKLLGQIDPRRVAAASEWAARLISNLSARMSA